MLTNNKPSSFSSGFISTFLVKVVSIGLTFFTGVLITRILGPEQKGILTTVLVYPTILISFFSLGISQATIYYLGKKKYTVQEIFSQVTKLFLLVSLITITIATIILLRLEIVSSLVILLVVLTIPLNLLINYLSGFLLGLQKIKLFNSINWIPALLAFLVSIILVYLLDLSIIGALLSTITSLSFTAIYALVLLRKTVKFDLIINTKIIYAIISLGFVYAVVLLLNLLNYKVDIIVLEYFVGQKEIGLYSAGVGIAELLWMIPTFIAPILISKSSNTKDYNIFTQKTAQLLRIVLVIVSLTSLFLFLFSDFFIQILFGESFSKSALVIKYLLPGILFFVPFKILNGDLAGRGKPYFAMYAMGSGVVLNVGLNIYLIPKFGIQGAAIASSISYTFSALIFIWIYSKVTKYSIRKIFKYSKTDFDFIFNKIKFLKFNK